jgi:RHS repeat-associated protein
MTRCLLVLTLLLATVLLNESAMAARGYGVGINSSVRVGKAPLPVTFSLRTTTERGGRIRDAEIDFGDGSRADARGRQAIRHTYRGPGRFVVTITITTDSGEQLSARTRVRVRPERQADPGELLQVQQAEGQAPFEATFTLGGESLPFTANSAVLDFGDGSSRAVPLLSDVSHRYERPGRYRATLVLRGRYGNVARARASVAVRAPPRLRLLVAPREGVAPLEVTVRGGFPSGQVTRRQITLDGETFARSGGYHRHLFDAPGTYEFALEGLNEFGEQVRKSATVVVHDGDLNDYYDHDGGVVEIRGEAGAFEAILLSPTLAQAQLGYDIGDKIARGVYGDVAQTYETEREGRPRRFYDRAAERVSEGSYLIKGGACPVEDQWSPYRFQVDFGEGMERPASIDGQVEFTETMQRYQRAYRERGLVPPRPGIIGRLRFVRDLIDQMKDWEVEGDPHECVTDHDATQTRGAAFRRIGRAEAERLNGENIEEVRGYSRDAYDGIGHPPATPAEREETEARMTSEDPDFLELLQSMDPVLLHSGEYYETSIDLELPGRGLDWRFQRTYRSQNQDHTSLGRGWTHNVMHALMQDGDDWLWRGPTGTWLRFRAMADGLYTATGGERLLIDEDERILRDADGVLHRFVPAPNAPEQSVITALEDTFGNSLVFETDLWGRVSSVTDSLGRVARYSYGAQSDYLSEVIAPDGRRLAFAHDAEGRLVAVRHFAPGEDAPYREITYAYDSISEAPELRDNITRIWGTGGTPDVEMRHGIEPGGEDYDRVTWQRNAQSYETFAYAREGSGDGLRFETRVEAEGRATERHLFRLDGQLASLTYEMADGHAITVTRDYDANGRLISETKPLGNRVETHWREGGLAKEVRHAPPPGSDYPVRAFLIEYEPLFRQVKAVYGPFAGQVPADPTAMLVHRNDYDYEEAPLPESLTRFGFAVSGQALGDVNGDGISGIAAGRLVRRSQPVEGTMVHALFETSPYGLPSRVTGIDDTITEFTYQTGASGEPLYLAEVIETRPGGARRTLAGYEWDEWGTLIGVQDGNGGHVGIVTDALGRPRQLIPDDPDRLRRRLEYDAHGRVTGEWLLSEADRLAEAEGVPFAAYSYDGRGNLVRLRLWADEETVIERGYAYDAYGRLLTMAGVGGTWRRAFDGLGRVVSEGMDGAGMPQRRFAYDDNGNLVSESVGEAALYQYRYDGHDRLIATERPDGSRLETDLDIGARVLERQVLDATGQVLHAQGASYTAQGRLVETWLGNAARTSVAYDDIGRLTEVNRADGRVISLSYDANGWLSAIEDGEVLVAIGHDAAGQVSMVDAAGYGRMGLSYSPNGRLDAIANASGVVEGREEDWQAGQTVLNEQDGVEEIARTTVERDRLQRPRRIQVSEGGPRLDWSLDWDDQSRLTRLRNGESVLAEMAYDAAGRLTSRRYFGTGAVTYAYTADGYVAADAIGDRAEADVDAMGRVTGVRYFSGGAAEPTSTLSFTYDALDRLVAHERDGWQWSRAFDGLGNVVRDSMGDAASQYPLSRITDSELLARYDGRGRLAGVALGVTELAIEREDGRVTRRLSASGETLLGVSHETGPRGRLLAYAVDQFEARIERDELGRLVAGAVPLPGGVGELAMAEFTYAYDANGNRTASNVDMFRAAIVPRESYGPANIDGAAVSYDANGAIIAIGDAVFERAPGGKLTAYRNDAEGVAISYRRDAFDRVVERRSGDTVTTYLWDGDLLVSVLENGAPTRDYIYDDAGRLLGAVVGGESLLAVTGPDQSLLALVDGTGEIAERYHYGPFGETYSHGSPPQGARLFAGMLYDAEAELYLTAGRSYMPRLGRFLSPEPHGPFVASHPYAYALDDPLSFRDVQGALPTAPDPDTESTMPFFSQLRDAMNAESDEIEGVTEAMLGEDGGEGEGEGAGGGSGSGGRSEGGTAGPDTGWAQPGGGASEGNNEGSWWDQLWGPSDQELAEREARARQQAIREAENDLAEIDNRDRRRRAAERDARTQARKRNLAEALRRLPPEVARQWIEEMLIQLPSDAGDLLPPLGGPRGPTPLGGEQSDPHGLLRDVLNDLDQQDPDGGSRVRDLYAGYLGGDPSATSVPVPGAGGSTHNPGAATRPPGQGNSNPGGASGSLPLAGPMSQADDALSGGGGSQPPRRPGGMAGGLF